MKLYSVWGVSANFIAFLIASLIASGCAKSSESVEFVKIDYCDHLEYTDGYPGWIHQTNEPVNKEACEMDIERMGYSIRQLTQEPQ